MRVRPKRSRAKLAVLLSSAVPLVCWDQEWRGRRRIAHFSMSTPVSVRRSRTASMPFVVSGNWAVFERMSSSFAFFFQSPERCNVITRCNDVFCQQRMRGNKSNRFRPMIRRYVIYFIHFIGHNAYLAFGHLCGQLQ